MNQREQDALYIRARKEAIKRARNKNISRDPNDFAFGHLRELLNQKVDPEPVVEPKKEVFNGNGELNVVKPRPKKKIDESKYKDHLDAYEEATGIRPDLNGDPLFDPERPEKYPLFQDVRPLIDRKLRKKALERLRDRE